MSLNTNILNRCFTSCLNLWTPKKHWISWKNGVKQNLPNHRITSSRDSVSAARRVAMENGPTTPVVETHDSCAAKFHGDSPWIRISMEGIWYPMKSMGIVYPHIPIHPIPSIDSMFNIHGDSIYMRIGNTWVLKQKVCWNFSDKKRNVNQQNGS